MENPLEVRQKLRNSRIPNSQGGHGNQMNKIIEMMQSIDLYKAGETKEQLLKKISEMPEQELKGI